MWPQRRRRDAKIPGPSVFRFRQGYFNMSAVVIGSVVLNKNREDAF